MPAQINILDEITVDGFCGGGGWSTGMELALGEPVTIGINHDAAAIAMHKKNHPNTKHYNENIYTVDPYEACEGRKVGWAHFSPDCTHFSVAKGGTPVKKNIRGLAWVVTKWAGTVKPRIISMENVKEFITWGPLIAKRDEETGRCLKYYYEYDPITKKSVQKVGVAKPGERVPIENQLLRPDPKRMGQTFHKFLSAMEELGYKYEYRKLVACDYGAPTSRERLFIIFRRDGKPIIWPQATHGDPKTVEVKSGKLKPWHTAAECIDWSENITSIFDRKKPLAENTCKRIARGIKRFIAENPEPFIVDYKFSNNSRGVNDPLSTITAVNDHYLVSPVITQIGQTSSENRASAIDTPLKTIVSKNEHCLTEAVLAPTIMCNNAGNVGSAVNEPLHAITTGNRHFLVAPTLLQYHSETKGNEARGQTVDKPIQTVDTANRYALTTAFLEKAFGGGYTGAGCDIDNPVPTITSKDHNRLITAFIERQFGTSTGHKVDEPLGTITGKNKSALVEVFLEKYGGGSNVIEVNGEKYKIVDICMRMLTPRELYLAQGFPKDYVIEWEHNGKPYPKTQQVANAGNSVPPPFATALVRANWPERCVKPINTMSELNELIYEVS